MLQIIKKSTLLLVLTAGLFTLSFAQEAKIGYANIELILAYMPETKTMNQTLATYEKKLGEQLQTKQAYAQSKYEDYLALAETNPGEAVLKPKEEELTKLQQEIQQFQTESQQKLLAKRQDLLEPIVEKIQTQIDAVAKTEGYNYIMNTVDGSGVSIILHAPEEYDLTKTLMSKLGIDVSALEGGN